MQASATPRRTLRSWQPAPKFRHLSAFFAVCQHGNVSLAAAHSSRTKSALTRAIHTLERQLGVELLVRAGDTLSCTDRGQVLLARVTQAISAYQRALAISFGGNDTSASVSWVPASMFDDRQLEVLVALSKTGSVSAVSAALSVSPAFITRAINTLERDIDIDLFYRDKDHVQITERGAQFACHIDRGLQELKRINSDLCAR